MSSNTFYSDFHLVIHPFFSIMKLHLPTALRRALLAITALLSPAVVTTTLATATLASFSAAAMAEDYTLLDVEVLNEDVEYGSVTVDK